MTENVKVVIPRIKIDRAWCRRCGWAGKTTDMKHSEFDLADLLCPDCLAEGEESIEYYSIFEEENQKSDNTKCPECGDKTTLSRVCTCGWFEDYEVET